MGDEKSRLGEIIGQCWKDAAFKKKFIADPKAVFAQFGIEIPAGLTVKVVENTDTTMYVTLPSPPASDEMNDADLAAVAGGAAGSAGPSSSNALRASHRLRNVFSMPTSTQGKECIPW